MQSEQLGNLPLARASINKTLRKEEVSPSIQAVKSAATDFSNGLPELLKHLKYGDIKKGKSYGIHFFDCGLHRVREYINPANKLGVWEAKIDVRHPKTNAWVQKQKSSTLFPFNWSEEILALKLTNAFQNSKRITHYKYCGDTDCGISIVFILQYKLITCCYPVWK